MTSFYEQLFKTSLFRNTCILQHTFNQKKKKNHQTHTIYAMLCKIVFPLHVTLLVMITEKKCFDASSMDMSLVI